MADTNLGPKLAGLRSLQASLDQHRIGCAAQCASAPPGWLSAIRDRLLRVTNRPMRLSVRSRGMRRAGIACAIAIVLIPVALALLWWRLSFGPIPLDVATPWITAAIKENFGDKHSVEVGGTILERDQAGRPAVRIVNVVVREPDGTVVASAPRAEVGIVGSSLLTGRPRAASLKLVGTALSIRIGHDGQFTLLPRADIPAPGSGDTKSAAAATSPVAAPAPAGAPSKSFLSEGPRNFTALLGWIDSLRALGLDGYDLNEVGLKDGRLVIEDERNGQQSVFDNINISVTRSPAGEVVLSIGSNRADHRWQLLASVKTDADGARILSVDAQRIALRDLLLALRMGDGQLEAEMPFSGSLNVEVAPNGMPRSAKGQLVLDAGTILTEAGNKYSRMAIDRAELKLDWDSTQGSLQVPLHVVSGENRFDLVAKAEAPKTSGEPWTFGLADARILFAPIDPGSKPLLLNRIVVRGRFDPTRQRVDLDQGDLAGDGVGISAKGSLDFSGEPHLAIKMTATPRLPVATLKQIWPVPANPGVRGWVIEHFHAGTVEQIDVATNAPLRSLQPGGPPVADDGMVITVVASGVNVQPVDELPPITEADVVTRIIGRATTMTMGRGTVEVSPGRKLTVTNGVLEIPDGYALKPPARARMRIEGPAPAAAELLANERLREAAGQPLDPAQTKGTLTAQVALAFVIDPDDPKGAVNYNINADLANFSIDHFVMSQRIESPSLRVAATNQGYQVKGDVRIGGMVAAIDYRKLTSEPDAQFRLTGNFDDAARAKLGMDVAGTLVGAIPVKLAGRLGVTPDQESRFTVEADLTQAKIDGLIPGWLKAPGRPARATFTQISRGKTFRCEDLVIDGSGTNVKGTLEFDDRGEIVSANLPTFALSEGDKANVKAERASDGQLKVTLRGEVYDGRGFVKTTLGSSSSKDQKPHRGPDFDLDAKLGAVAGFNGEAIRSMDVKISRRGGQFRAFSLSSKLGVDTPFTGELRPRGNKPVVVLETNDAGALFRFTDTYAKMFGGQFWLAMEPPAGDQTAQDGTLSIRNFVVRGESGLDRVVTGAPGGAPNGVPFTGMQVEFTRSPGKLVVREGVVRGPIVGATMEGQIDYIANDVNLRGTFVPLYGLNNAFGQIPLVGLLMGGPNEGLVGITYRVAGPPGRSVLQINPVSAIAPGIFRKPFEFQDWATPQPPLADR
jgi:hypothetical protein